MENKNVYEPNFATFFVKSTFDMLLNVLDDFHFLCFISCVGGLRHKKGVYILDLPEGIPLEEDLAKTYLYRRTKIIILEASQLGGV